MNEAQPLIAMVDDNPAVLKIGKNALSKNYTVATLSSAERLFVFLQGGSTPDLILLDVMMPGIDGYETIRMLKSKEQTQNIPVIFLTGKADAGNELAGLNLGAVDFIAKPFVPDLLLKRIELHLLVESQKKGLETQQRQLENFNANLQNMVEAKTQAVIALQNAIIKTVADLVERRDSFTGGHIDRTMWDVGILVKALMENNSYRNECARWDVDLLMQSSQLHDVGKIAVGDKILKKPGPLDPEEREEMEKHVLFGVQVIDQMMAATMSANTEDAFLDYAKTFASAHHERWDGKGYPQGLRGEEIPLLGRVMAIADVYDALVSERPYKKPFTHDAAVKLMLSGKGTHFDPRLVDLFMGVSGQFQVFTEADADHHLRKQW